MARLACTVTAVVLIVFAIAGKWIFKYLSISMPAFQIAASVVLMLVATDMLRAQRSRVQETKEETAEGSHKTDIAITPLAGGLVCSTTPKCIIPPNGPSACYTRY